MPPMSLAPPSGRYLSFTEREEIALRQYFPKGTDLARHTATDLEAIATTLNTRPRKTLGWKTPAEVLNDQLVSVQKAGVATTP